jgi:hypothetical protein
MTPTAIALHDGAHGPTLRVDVQERGVWLMNGRVCSLRGGRHCSVYSPSRAPPARTAPALPKTWSSAFG